MLTNNAINNIQDTELPIGALCYFSNGGTDTTYMNQWLKCDGATYSQSTYPVLFSRLGLINGQASFWQSSASYTTTLSTFPIALAYGNSTYCLAAGTIQIFTSTDFISWTNQGNLNSTYIQDLSFCNNLFIASMGSVGYIQTSTNGVSWNARILIDSGGAVNSVTYYNSQYIACAYHSVYTSTDTNSWTSKKTFTDQVPQHIFYNGSQYVLQTQTALLSSTDLITWTLQSSTLTNATFYGLTYGDSLFVAVGTKNLLVTSTNGTSWTLQTNTLINQQTNWSVTYGNGIYVIGQDNGIISTSANGAEWNQCVTPTISATVQQVRVPTVMYENGDFYAAIGNNVWEATSTYPYNSATQFQVPLDNNATITKQSKNGYSKSLYIRATT